MSNLRPLPRGIVNILSREEVAYFKEIMDRINEKLDDQSGLSGTYTFGGGGTGDIASMTFVNGILTSRTLVP